jgi:hypothetical protein
VGQSHFCPYFPDIPIAISPKPCYHNKEVGFSNRLVYVKVPKKMYTEISKLYNRDGISVKGFIFALSLPYCAHFSMVFQGGIVDRASSD